MARLDSYNRQRRRAGLERSTMNCKEKIWYPTLEMAQQARIETIEIASDKKHAKQLVTYQCRDCRMFHVGHLRRRFPDMPKLTPAPVPIQKPKTPAQIRRANKRLEKDNIRQARFALNVAGWNVTDLNVAADRLQDQADSLRQAAQIMQEYLDRNLQPKP